MPDTDMTCYDRYVALTIQVIDDEGVLPTDAITIEVSKQTRITERELTFLELPSVPDIDVRPDA